MEQVYLKKIHSKYLASEFCGESIFILVTSEISHIKCLIN